MRGQPEPFGLRAVSYRNDSGTTVPPYGIIKITGTTKENGTWLFTGDQPDTWGSQYSHYVNGPFEVDNGKDGICYVPTSPVWAKYDDISTPAVGEYWGPKDSSFELFQHVGGFQVVSADVDDGKVLVIQRPLLWFRGKTNAAHDKGASGTIQVWSGSSIDNLSDTSNTKTDVYNAFADLEANKWVICNWHKDDEWELVAGECA